MTRPRPCSTPPQCFLISLVHASFRGQLKSMFSAMATCARWGKQQANTRQVMRVESGRSASPSGGRLRSLCWRRHAAQCTPTADGTGQCLALQGMRASAPWQQAVAACAARQQALKVAARGPELESRQPCRTLDERPAPNRAASQRGMLASRQIAGRQHRNLPRCQTAWQHSWMTAVHAAVPGTVALRPIREAQSHTDAPGQRRKPAVRPGWRSSAGQRAGKDGQGRARQGIYPSFRRPAVATQAPSCRQSRMAGSAEGLAQHCRCCSAPTCRRNQPLQAVWPKRIAEQHGTARHTRTAQHGTAGSSATERGPHGTRQQPGNIHCSPLPLREGG